MPRENSKGSEKPSARSGAATPRNVPTKQFFTAMTKNKYFGKRLYPEDDPVSYQTVYDFVKTHIDFFQQWLAFASSNANKASMSKQAQENLQARKFVCHLVPWVIDSSAPPQPDYTPGKYDKATKRLVVNCITDLGGHAEQLELKLSDVSTVKESVIVGYFVEHILPMVNFLWKLRWMTVRLAQAQSESPISIDVSERPKFAWQMEGATSDGSPDVSIWLAPQPGEPPTIRTVFETKHRRLQNAFDDIHHHLVKISQKISDEQIVDLTNETLYRKNPNSSQSNPSTSAATSSVLSPPSSTASHFLTHSAGFERLIAAEVASASTSPTQSTSTRLSTTSEVLTSSKALTSTTASYKIIPGGYTFLSNLPMLTGLASLVQGWGLSFMAKGPIYLLNFFNVLAKLEASPASGVLSVSPNLLRKPTQEKSLILLDFLLAVFDDMEKRNQEHGLISSVWTFVFISMIFPFIGQLTLPYASERYVFKFPGWYRFLCWELKGGCYTVPTRQGTITWTPFFVLKEFDDNRVFETEYEALRSLRGYQGIMQLFGKGVSMRGKPCVVMEDGGQPTRFSNDDPSEWDNVAPILEGIHTSGWHHHDLHGENVLEDANGLLSIIDFGNAVRAEMCSEDERCPDWKFMRGKEE
ncbi:hypothetical protein DFP72DRAFT_1080966 [Ephemerocybe angulata]|uniref:Protein kinase domain-containing protein n=1 Tax=Ephemerocybe angulata TaxID=980116 RepID=A0A8H6H9Q1_9AGAR|nr:hypothetical protein DFP72DRAFT_1080966 [Tulosesus angulatus]